MKKRGVEMNTLVALALIAVFMMIVAGIMYRLLSGAKP